MIRRLSIAILAAAALAGCATGYGYSSGYGDYYYGRGGGYDYYDYGYGPSYYGGGYGYGYGSPYRYYGSYGYPYYSYPYYGYPHYHGRPPRDDDDRPDYVDRSKRRNTGPGLPDKSGVDRGRLTVGAPSGPGDAGRSRVRDPRELRAGRPLARPAPPARQGVGRSVQAPVRSAPVQRPAPVRRTPAAPVRPAPVRPAPVRVREAPARREAPSRSRGGGERRAVPL